MATHVRLMGPGSYEPDRSLTGVRPRVSLTTLTGNQTITEGVTLTAREITGRVDVQTGETVTLTDCLIRGDPTITSEHGVLHLVHSSVADVQLVNCTISPSSPTKYMTGILGHHYTATRCLIERCVDGAGVYNTSDGDAPSGVTIQGCWIGRHGWWEDAPNQSDGSHCDGIQLQGGTGTVIRWNRIEAYHDSSIGESPWGRNNDSQYRAVSALMITPNVGEIADIEVYANWFGGGEICNNVMAGGNSGAFVGTWTGNVFDDDQYHDDHSLDFVAGCTYSASGNQWRDTTAITVRQY